MPFTLRPARATDIAALARLIPESVRGLSGGFYTPEQVESALAHIFGVDTRLMDDGTYFVAEADGQIVGGGGWSRRTTLFGGDQRKAGSPDDLLDPATHPARRPGVLRSSRLGPPRDRPGAPGRVRVGGASSWFPIAGAGRDAAGRAALHCVRVRSG